MAKYRKKPVVIDAWQYTPDSCADLCRMLGVPHRDSDEPCGTGPLPIQTLEGTMLASPGDYVIRGVKGEFYPCKPDIFVATYEPADGEARRG